MGPTATLYHRTHMDNHLDEQLEKALQQTGNWQGKSLLTLKDYTSEELQSLLELARVLKLRKQNRKTGQLLAGRNIVLLFEKTSTRTRCAFEVAVMDEGGHSTFLGAQDSQLGKKESLEDTARVLGRFYDGIQFRGYRHSTVEALAAYSGVPVWNGLTDQYHPTQALADFMTLTEHVHKPFSQMSLAYVGDARNNMANSLMIGAAKLGMEFRAVAPAGLFPDPSLVDEMQAVAKENGGKITLTEDTEAGVRGVDAIYTDVWVSMGEEEQLEERIRLLQPYQVNTGMMERTGNPHALFMHCLPAFHDTETLMGWEIHEKYGLEAMEVTDEVFRSSQSVVFDEAENRIHTIKALMVATLGFDG